MLEVLKQTGHFQHPKSPPFSSFCSRGLSLDHSRRFTTYTCFPRSWCCVLMRHRGLFWWRRFSIIGSMQDIARLLDRSPTGSECHRSWFVEGSLPQLKRMLLQHYIHRQIQLARLKYFNCHWCMDQSSGFILSLLHKNNETPPRDKNILELSRLYTLYRLTSVPNSLASWCQSVPNWRIILPPRHNIV